MNLYQKMLLKFFENPENGDVLDLKITGEEIIKVESYIALEKICYILEGDGAERDKLEKIVILLEKLGIKV